VRGVENKEKREGKKESRKKMVGIEKSRGKKRIGVVKKDAIGRERKGRDDGREARA
jgi:hypothetical protein